MKNIFSFQKFSFPNIFLILYFSKILSEVRNKINHRKLKHEKFDDGIKIHFYLENLFILTFCIGNFFIKKYLKTLNLIYQSNWYAGVSLNVFILEYLCTCGKLQFFFSLVLLIFGQYMEAQLSNRLQIGLRTRRAEFKF